MQKCLKIFLISILTFIAFSTQASAQVYDFEYTGEVQSFTIDRSGYYELRAWGAQGGSGYNTGGGNGGYAEGEMLLEEGTKLKIYVGGQGGTPSGGWNGGGDGGIDTGAGQTGGGGGGSSDIRVGGSDLQNRVIVAGGGAGGGRDGKTGEGGGLTGSKSDDYNDGYAGEPGTQSEGGDAHTTSRGATSGGLGFGGNGSTDENAAGGGGGGSGYYGGGGGTSTRNHGSGWSSGGGGGSSYIEELDNASTNTGVNSGHGKIEIEFIEERKLDFCNVRGDSNQCIMNETNQLNNQQYNVSSIFEARQNAVFEAFNGQATLKITNSTSISGLWTGSFRIQTQSPRINPGASFKPETGNIIIGN